MAKKNRTPMLRSAMTKPGANGTTANEISAVATIMAGARTKTGLAAKGGIQSSLVNNFTESATTCPKPNGPTRLGPYRSCHNASRRRSTQMSPAARLSTTNRTTAMISKGKRFDIMQHLWRMVQSWLVQVCRWPATLSLRLEAGRLPDQLRHEAGRLAALLRLRTGNLQQTR